MMTTRSVNEIDDEIARHREALGLFEGARKREAGVPAALEAGREEALAAHGRAIAALFAAGEHAQPGDGPGFLMEPYAEIGITDPRLLAEDPSLPPATEIHRLRRRFAEAKEAAREARAKVDRATGALVQARDRQADLDRRCALMRNQLEALQAERARVRAAAGIRVTHGDRNRSRLARLRAAVVVLPGAEGD